MDRTLKTLQTILILGLISLAVDGCTKKEDSYQIGVVTPLTGQLSFLGEFTKQGLEMAKDDIDSSGGIGGRRIALVYEDTKSNPKDAVTSITKLIGVDKLPVIIGDITSSATQAMAPIAEQNKVVLFANGASAPGIRFAGDYIFRNWNSDDYEAKPMAEYAFGALKYRRVGIVYAQDDYTLGLKNAFEKFYTEIGGTIVGSFDYVKNTRDFRTIILKIPKDVDALYVVGWPAELGYFVRQSKDLRRAKPYLSSISAQSEDFLKIAGNGAEGLVYTAPTFDPEIASGTMKDFIERFRRRYGKDPDVVSAVSYDALMIVANAIRSGGYDPDGIKRALYSTKEYPGVSGVTSFDEYGDVSKPVSIKSIRGGKFVYLDSPLARVELHKP